MPAALVAEIARAITLSHHALPVAGALMKADA
jgi:hypothetical protein